MIIQRRPSRRKRHSRQLNSFRPRLEALEDRRVLATFTVSNADDTGEGSLRDAIEQANMTEGADDIVFEGTLDGDTITLTSGQLDITDHLSIDASNLDSLSIDAAGLDATPGNPDGQGGRIFDVTAGTAAFNGLTLLNGDVVGDGGAIRSTGALTIDAVNFEENAATGSGGAIAVTTVGEDVSIDSSKFENNSAGVNGGAVFVDGNGGSFTLAESSVSNNSATGNGGGIYSTAINSDVLIDVSHLESNQAGSSGGGMHAESAGNGTTTVRRSTLNLNSANDGGALYMYSRINGSVTITNSTVSRNSAAMRGGGLTLERNDASATALVEQATIVNNRTEGTGAGIHAVNLAATVNNSIVANNTVGMEFVGADTHGAVEATNSLIEFSADMGNISGSGNIFGEAPVLRRLDFYGGPTMTHDLWPTSPAVDAGSPDVDSGDFDQRGLPYDRVVDGDMNGTSTVDMGAVELSINVPPVADAGPEAVSAGPDVAIVLDGSDSFDPDDGPLSLTYQWTVVLGEGAVLGTPDAETTTFTAPTIGTYVVLLTVSDGQSTETDTINVNVMEDFNRAPTADASLSETTGTVMDPVNLDGTLSSDPDGDDLTYQWSVVARPAGATTIIADATAETTTLTADTVGFYRVRLIVDDGMESSAPVSFRIFIDEINLPPTANVSLSQNSGFVDTPVTLDGTRSTHPDDDPLTYEWSIIAQPDGSSFNIADSMAAATTVTFDSPGEYRARLVVSDGMQDSAPVTFIITISDNAPPTANVSLSQNSGVVDVPIRLDGTRSSDPDGDPLTYLWQIVLQPDGSSFTIDDETAASTTLVVDTLGDYRVQLTVDDGETTSAPVRFLVNVSETGENSRPIADVSLSENTGVVGLFTQLDGTRSSDPDGDMLTYLWSIVSQPPGSSFGFINENAAQTELTFDTAGEYRVSLVVNDGELDSLPVTFIVDVAAQAMASGASESNSDLGDESADERNNVLDDLFASFGNNHVSALFGEQLGN